MGAAPSHRVRGRAPRYGLRVVLLDAEISLAREGVSREPRGVRLERAAAPRIRSVDRDEQRREQSQGEPRGESPRAPAFGGRRPKARHVPAPTIDAPHAPNETVALRPLLSRISERR